MWRIKLSKQTNSFAKTEHVSDDELLTLLGKFVAYLEGKNENIDVKKMKGEWKGYHRIRMGKIRLILRVDFAARSIFVDRMDYRGDVYK
jgi:mRNA interferase RelE/StbE